MGNDGKSGRIEKGHIYLFDYLSIYLHTSIHLHVYTLYAPKQRHSKKQRSGLLHHVACPLKRSGSKILESMHENPLNLIGRSWPFTGSNLQLSMLSTTALSSERVGSLRYHGHVSHVKRSASNVCRSASLCASPYAAVPHNGSCKLPRAFCQKAASCSCGH